MFGVSLLLCSMQKYIQEIHFYLVDGFIVVIFVPNFWILNRPSDDLIRKSRDTETSRKP